MGELLLRTATGGRGTAAPSVTGISTAAVIGSPHRSPVKAAHANGLQGSPSRRSFDAGRGGKEGVGEGTSTTTGIEEDAAWLAAQEAAKGSSQPVLLQTVMGAGKGAKEAAAEAARVQRASHTTETSGKGYGAAARAQVCGGA